MGGKFVDQGRNDAATKYVKSEYSNLYLGLYKNTTEPAQNATLASLTEESGSGYARIALASADWTVTANVAENLQKTFTPTADWGNVYGYFIATSTDGSGLLLWVEHFSNGPYNLLNGVPVKITPKVTITG
ncbi:MAG: hypothetical protein QY317_16145 [Candidatus Jettenia caeni]|nr:MAG: hypothetical protein QY317_16145 [Candidatus Jettenia caeni]